MIGPFKSVIARFYCKVLEVGYPNKYSVCNWTTIQALSWYKNVYGWWRRMEDVNGEEN